MHLILTYHLVSQVCLLLRFKATLKESLFPVHRPGRYFLVDWGFFFYFIGFFFFFSSKNYFNFLPKKRGKKRGKTKDLRPKCKRNQRECLSQHFLSAGCVSAVYEIMLDQKPGKKHFLWFEFFPFLFECAFGDT